MTHEDYMKEALSLAREALADGEVPVGCVVVWDGTIVGRGRNRREGARTALGHAEIEAIAQACKALNGWRLHRATLYVTLEPCPMCAGAILNARIAQIRYGAKDDKAGCCGSVLNLFEEDFHHHPRIYGGLMEAECSALMQAFFQSLRSPSCPSDGPPAGLGTARRSGCIHPASFVCAVSRMHLCTFNIFVTNQATFFNIPLVT